MADATVFTPDTLVATDADLDVEFTETYSDGTADVGDWLLTTDMMARTIEVKGGDPGGYLQAGVSTSIPTWQTASTRFQPGVNDEFKRDSVFVGDYYDESVKTLGVDLNVLVVGSWTSNRALNLHLTSWDVAKNGVAFDAFYVFPDITTAPVGWNHYDVNIDARSTTVPPGWTLTRGDGMPGTDADWATFMHQIDLVGFGFWKPGYVYPNLNSWMLGIDNIHITSQH